MTEKILDGVRRWAETSGRALELRVARASVDAGADVHRSFGYTDVVEGKDREGDVLATFPWRIGYDVELGFAPDSFAAVLDLSVVVECKESKDPWVGFPDPLKPPTRLISDWVVKLGDGARQRLVSADAQDMLRLGKPPFDGRPVATHIATAHDNRNNPANGAVRQAISCALGVAAQPTWTPLREQDRSQPGLLLAAVVTTAPLVACYLSHDNQLLVEEVDRMDVWVPIRELGRRRVHVIRERAFPDFIGAVAQRAADLEQATMLRQPDPPSE